MDAGGALYVSDPESKGLKDEAYAIIFPSTSRNILQ